MVTTVKNKKPELLSSTTDIQSQQLTIQNRCFHPKGGFVAFKREDIEQSIAARFEAQVQAYPAWPAVKTGLRALTYEELNQAANRIAHALIAQQGDKEEPVVLLFEHGLAMVTAIMGALKAGKIYVPLDPAYPPARNAYILEHSEAGLLVTNTQNLVPAQQLAQENFPLLNTDELPGDIPDDNLSLALSPNRLAYIIYTSGSTGQPKGVYQNQRNLLHEIMQYTNTLHLCRYDRFTLLYSCSVNGSLRDIFGALLNGASLYTYDVKTEGLTDLAQWLVDNKITFYHSVPTLFRYFMDTLAGTETFPDVRLIRFGGERVPQKNVDLYKKYFPPHCIMYTGMGATETSTVRQFFVDKDTPIDSSVVPTGLAIAEREVLLFDERDNEVENNQVGQIVIRSPYLALGYWRQPNLTQQKFKVDPTQKNSRLYYTGDLGRLLPDGTLIHFGRKDFQVKIRGYRIEITEIEMALLEHDSIKEVAVVAGEDKLADSQLVAYITTQATQKPSLHELNLFLKDKLPEYMIPARYVLLDHMPLTPNGKINRSELLQPEPVSWDTDYVPPRSHLEQQLVNIWEDVLGIQPIGITHNFFDIGGHSLLAMQLAAQIEKSLRKKIPPAILFQAPTIEGLAKIINQESAGSPFSALVPLKTAGNKQPFFCVPGNLGNAFTDLEFLAQTLDPTRPFYGFQDNAQNFVKIENVAAHYLAEMRMIQPTGPYILGGICWGGPVAFEIAQQLRKQGEVVALLVLVEPSRPWVFGLHPYLNIAFSTLRRLIRRIWYHSQTTTRLQPGERKTYTHIKFKVIANQWATRHYTPKPYSGAVHLVMGHESMQNRYNHRLDWQHWAINGITLHQIPGTHDTITGNNNTKISNEAMRALAELLRHLLDEVLAGQDFRATD